MKPTKLIEYFFIITATACIIFTANHYYNTFTTVVRWQDKAIANYKANTDIHKFDKLQKVSEPLPTWVQEKPTKVAFDVWLSTASNIASVIGTTISIIAFFEARKRRKENDEKV